LKNNLPFFIHDYLTGGGYMPVPEEIIYVYPTRLTLTVDTAWGENKTVKPVFVVDAKKEKTLKTAKNWAKDRDTDWRNRTVTTPEPTVTKPIKNVPKSGYCILSIEHRSEGGRAYKVITPENYYIDFREDALMDVIRHVGIQAGGTLNGEYLFVQCRSQMKLVREGSDIHEKELARETAKKKGAIKTKDLKPGMLYADLGGNNLHWYIGPIKTCTYNVSLNHTHYYKGKTAFIDAESFVKHRTTKHLWYRVGFARRNQDWRPNLKDMPIHNFSVNGNSAIRVYEEVRQLTPISPKRIREHIYDNLGIAPAKTRHNANQSSLLASFSQLLNMRSVDEKEVFIHKLFEKIHDRLTK